MAHRVLVNYQTMKTEKKIFLKAWETAEDAVKHISRTAAAEVILNIPAESALASSVENFHVLAAAAENRKKTLSVESVDDQIIELASLAKIPAVNPIFRASERAVSDIVPLHKWIAEKRTKKEVLKTTKKERSEAVPEEENPTAMAVEENEGEMRKEAVLQEIFDAPRGDAKVQEKKNREKPPRPRHPRSARGLAAATLAVFFILFGGGWLVLFYLPEADITLTLKKTTVPLDGTVFVDSGITSPDLSAQNVVIPGEVLSAHQNLQMEFSASGTEIVSNKASGKLTIYNAFSSQPQVLVAATRFASPDGKIVRLNERVTIPAAKIMNGKILPSLIEAAVTADSAGAEYNLPAGTKWTIPGFKGTAKYDGFYAVNAEALEGGAIGEQAVPTKDDETSAKAKTESALRDALSAQMELLMSKDLKLLDGATLFTVTKETVRPVEGRANAFSVYVEGTLKEFLFNEPMLRKALTDKAKQSLPNDLEAIAFNASYGTPQIDFQKETMQLPVTGFVLFATPVDIASLTDSLKGKDERSVRRTIFSLPGLESATVTLRPFWVRRVPSNPLKIHIAAE